MQRVRSADGTDIALDRSGDGPPLVLVGGAFQDRSSMKAVAAGLRDAFTVYEYDRRGRGDSGNTLPTDRTWRPLPAEGSRTAATTRPRPTS